MKLNSIKLHNIRSYQDQTIVFSLGTSLFAGDMGSGKSTILMAIEFAMFGLGSQTGASLLRMGAKEGFATLSFSVENKDYQITRKLYRKRKTVSQKEGVITTPRETIHLSATELKERILEILDFREPADPNAQSFIYRYAIFTPQEEMKTILTKSPKERVQTLRKALGIEDYKIASDNAGILARQIENEISKLSGSIKDLDGKKKELKQDENDHTRLLKEQCELTKEKESLVASHKKSIVQLSQLQKNKERYDNASIRIPGIKKQIDNRSKDIKNFMKECKNIQRDNDVEINPEIKNISAKKKPTEKTKDTLKKEIQALRRWEQRKVALLHQLQNEEAKKKELLKKLGSYKDKNSKQIKNKIADIEKNITKCSSTFKKISEDLRSIRNEKAKAEQRIEDIKKKVDGLKGARGLCPICKQKLTDTHQKHLAKERELERHRIKAELVNFEKNEKLLELNGRQSEKKLAKFKDEISKLENVEDYAQEFEKIKKMLFKINDEIKELNLKLNIKEEESFKGLSRYESPSYYLQAVLEELTDYHSAKKTLKNYKNQLEKNEKQMKRLSEQIRATCLEVEKSRKELRILENTQAKLKGIHEKADEMEEIVDERNLELRKLEEQISENKGDMKRLDKNMKRLGNEIEQKKKEKISQDKLKDYHVWVKEFLMHYFHVIETQVMAARKQEFEIIFQKWYSMLLDEPDKEARVDEEFTPIIEQDGQEQKIDYLSGGEKTSLALAYRLALNTIVQKVSTGMKSNLLILDEPTDGFSKSQLYKVREVLQELDCPQIIIVSHETELENFASRIYEVVKTNGISSVISK